MFKLILLIGLEKNVTIYPHVLLIQTLKYQLIHFIHFSIMWMIYLKICWII